MIQTNIHEWIPWLLLSGFFLTIQVYAQSGAVEARLPSQYEELSAREFPRALEQSGATCVIPMGILEKHGPHLPLGTDLLDAREIALRAAKKEYTIVFPAYYFGQIYEAKHQPGTIAYSPALVWQLLQETCDELARNGVKKIVLVNGHGGNNSFLNYFCQAQLAERKDYALVLFRPEDDPKVTEKIAALRKTTEGGHADEVETSMLLAHRPDLVHLEHAGAESGQNLARLSQIPYAFTGIWWYARYPNHYAGDGSQANPEIGALALNSEADQLVKLIQVLKQNDDIRQLQERFYQAAEKPNPK